MPFASLATAAARKCSTNLPTRISLRVAPNVFLVASKGAMLVWGRLVRYRYHARKREKYCSVRSTLSRPTGEEDEQGLWDKWEGAYPLWPQT